MPRKGPVDYKCSFCGKNQDQVKRLIAGPGNTYICDECVFLCNEILEQEEVLPNPARIAQIPDVTIQIQMLGVLNETITNLSQNIKQVPSDSFGHLVRSAMPLINQIALHYQDLLGHVERMREIEAQLRQTGQPPARRGRMRSLGETPSFLEDEILVEAIDSNNQ